MTLNIFINNIGLEVNRYVTVNREYNLHQSNHMCYLTVSVKLSMYVYATFNEIKAWV